MKSPTLFSLILLAASPALAQDSFGGAAPPQQQQPQQQYPQQQQQQPAYPQQQPAQEQPAYPQQQQPGGYPQQGPAQGNNALAGLIQAEQQDMGVPATDQLKSGGLHGPTPNQLPGGRLVTTPELVQLMQDQARGTLVFDVLGGQQMLPNAIPVVPASQGGSFDDQVQRDFGQYLQQVTQGRKDRPMVFYCQSNQCWMSYNAALRATRLGYTNVLWYRGGIEAWQQAGGPLVSPGAQGAPRQ